jgi:hypothetical protein
MTRTERRMRPRLTAAESPAGPPPTMAQSNTWSLEVKEASDSSSGPEAGTR